MWRSCFNSSGPGDASRRWDLIYALSITGGDHRDQGPVVGPRVGVEPTALQFYEDVILYEGGVPEAVDAGPCRVFSGSAHGRGLVESRSDKERTGSPMARYTHDQEEQPHAQPADLCANQSVSRLHVSHRHAIELTPR